MKKNGMAKNKSKAHFVAKSVSITAFAVTSIFAAHHSAAKEYVKGRKLYLADQVGWKTTLNAAADIMIAKACTPSMHCRNFQDEEVYFEGDKTWGWRRHYTYSINNDPSTAYNSFVFGPITWECPDRGWSGGDGKSSFCSRPDQTEPDPKGCGVGNPILPLTGTKEQIEVDYRGSDASGLHFVRTYRSNRNTWANNFQSMAIDFSVEPSSLPSWPGCYQGIGYQTSEPVCFPYVGPRTGYANDVGVIRGNGAMLNFGTATDFAPKADINDRVTKLTDTNGVITGWRVYVADNDTTELYDATGRLQTITASSGRIQTFTYSDSTTPTSIAPKAGLLISVADHFNRQLSFTYDDQGRMVTMTDPSGGIYKYAYDEPSSIVLAGKQLSNNLTSVTYPDGKKRIYWYNEQDKTGNRNQPNVLTGITDENGVRYATFTYDTSGMAISTEHAGGVNKYIVSYPFSTESLVTDPLGSVRKYNFQTILKVARVTSQSQPGGAGCNAASSGMTYDANGNVASRTDFNGNVTTYSYELSRNLETKRVEGSGTPQARTITTEWHATYRLPTRIAEPKRIITYTYDAKGNLFKKIEQATTDANGSQGFNATATGTPRTWSYTYNNVGQVLTATDPRNNTTTYAYDGQGNLSTITNAAGHVTTLSNYDANGRVGRIVDPNGLTTDLTYSPRGWLASRKIGGELTTYDYDGVGQLKKVTNPDGSFIAYTYDDAHRLTDITDSASNNIHYTLDAMGNRIKEEIKDPAGSLARQITRVYDALSRLQQVTGGMQ